MGVMFLPYPKKAGGLTMLNFIILPDDSHFPACMFIKRDGLINLKAVTI